MQQVIKALRSCLLLCGGLLLSACASAPPVDGDVSAEQATTAIHVIRHRWHTGLVLSAEQVEASPLAFLTGLPDDGAFYEIGFGDNRYYPLPLQGVSPLRRHWTALRAVLVPGASVLQVMVLEDAPEDTLHTDLERIPLTDTQLAQLTRLLFDEFALIDLRSAVPGDLPGQWFLPGKARFWLGNTCNTWTASLLEEAGAAHWHIQPLRAAPVMRGVRR